MTFDLKAFRAEASLTQAELAELWGVQPAMVSKWENAEDAPAMCEYAARALKADLDNAAIVAKAQPAPAAPSPAAPPEKKRRRLGRAPGALIQGIKPNDD